ncbi:MAG: hypothetical protein ACM3KM_00825 [Acidobacteriaceae bacterium]
MTIYFSHKTIGDYKQDFYQPLKELLPQFNFVFPHEISDDPYNSRALFASKKCDLVLAEMSEPSTGVGIELGWANAYGIPIVCCFRTGLKMTRSLNSVTKKFIAYVSMADLADKLGNLAK